MQPQQPAESLETSATCDAFAALDALPFAGDSPQISGRSSPENVAPVRAPARELAESDRDSIAESALPRLAAGASLRVVAKDHGLAPSTLRAWCLAYDSDAYRAALAAQVGAQLAGAAEELEECARMVRVASSMTLKGKMVTTSDGEKSTGYALHGPALASVARARASIALDAGKFWQWIGERRLPAVFGERDKTPPGARAASFTFIVDGRKTTARGRVLDAAPAGLHLGGALPSPADA